jgi:hypothetical protein
VGKITVLSEEDLLKAAAIPFQKTKEIIWRNKSITVKESVSLREYLDLMRRIIRDASDNDGHILYELVDFSTKVNIIGSYSFINLPKDAQKLFDIIYYTDLYQSVAKEVNQDQLNSITSSVEFYTGVRGGAL